MSTRTIDALTRALEQGYRSGDMYGDGWSYTDVAESIPHFNEPDAFANGGTMTVTEILALYAKYTPSDNRPGLRFTLKRPSRGTLQMDAIQFEHTIGGYTLSLGDLLLRRILFDHPVDGRIGEHDMLSINTGEVAHCRGDQTDRAVQLLYQLKWQSSDASGRAVYFVQDNTDLFCINDVPVPFQGVELAQDENSRWHFSGPAGQEAEGETLASLLNDTQRAYTQALVAALQSMVTYVPPGPMPADELRFYLTGDAATIAQHLRRLTPAAQARAIVLLETLRLPVLLQVQTQMDDAQLLRSAYTYLDHYFDSALWLTARTQGPPRWQTSRRMMPGIWREDAPHTSVERALLDYFALRVLDTEHADNWSGSHAGGLLTLSGIVTVGDRLHTVVLQGRPERIPSGIRALLPPSVRRQVRTAPSAPTGSGLELHGAIHE